MPLLAVAPLTQAAFAPFGDVIDAAAAGDYPINGGSARRHHDLMRIEVDGAGRTVVSVVQASARDLPFEVAMLERHPLGSQAWIPLDPRLRFLVVVASAPDAVPCAFLARDGQGVNYRAGTWHHPLIALDAGAWLVIDRDGPGANCDEQPLPRRWRLDPP